MGGERTSVPAAAICDCLFRMADKATNPVLEVLGAVEIPVQGEKYPPEKLRFGGNRLLAWYHSHPEPWLRDDEHGHFHVFVHAVSMNEWVHVAALSMDEMGQPRAWMATNHWVTGGGWMDGASLAECLRQVTVVDPDHLTLVETWLYYMLRLYDDDICQLLAKRDARLRAGTDPEDRSVYELACSPVDLLARLQTEMADLSHSV